MSAIQIKYQCYLQEFQQSYSYSVYFERQIFSPNNELLNHIICQDSSSDKVNLVVFMDSNLVTLNPQLALRVQDWFKQRHDHLTLVTDPIVLPGGEQVKNSWEYVHEITRILDQFSLDRHGFVIVVGGGALIDTVGFAASIYHRGIKLIRVPTTTLAQNDAGIGVKNGINQYGQKNCIGTFSPPYAVINDYSLLRTLPYHHFISGVAEAFKIALIRDRSLFLFLVENSLRLSQRNQDIIEKVIYRCACLHLDHIATSGDPFETGSSRPLDFGHWSAHKLELLSDHSICHGHAVSIGMALDSFYAWRLSLISEADLLMLLQALINCKLPIWNEHLSDKNHFNQLELEVGLEEFRRHLGGKLTFTMPNGIGNTCELHEMDFDLVREGIKYLYAFADDPHACQQN